MQFLCVLRHILCEEDMNSSDCYATYGSSSMHYIQKNSDKPYSEIPLFDRAHLIFITGVFQSWCLTKFFSFQDNLKKKKKSIILIDLLQVLKQRGIVSNISDKKIVSFCCRTFQSVLHTLWDLSLGFYCSDKSF